MGTAADKVLEAALVLPEAERARLVEVLLGTLDGVPEPGVDAAWAEEVERRTAELERGAVQGIPWEVVREQAARGARNDS